MATVLFPVTMTAAHDCQHMRLAGASGCERQVLPANHRALGTAPKVIS